MDTEKILSVIERAFTWRQPPKNYISSFQLDENEIAEVLSYQGKDWRSFTCKQLQEKSDLFLCSPEAFCYCLPGVMSAVIRENRPDLIMIDAIVNCLDRPPSRTNWDDYFLERWTKFTPEEYDAIEQFLGWLCEHDPNDNPFNDMFTVSARCVDTLNLLRERKR